MEHLNRAQRRAAKRAKPPPRGSGHVEIPITLRFSPADETKLMLEPIKCAERLRDGTAEEGDWHAVALRLNWARLLNKANFEDGESHFSEAQAAIRAVKDRFDQYGTWSTSTPEWEAVERALTRCNQMQRMCTRRELRDSLEAVYLANEYQAKIREIKDQVDRRVT